MRINNNIMAMNTHRQLGINNNGVAKSLEKLSSGFRINRAGDDAAGLSISEKMRAQIRGLNMASKNAQDGISMIQTTEGGLQEAQAILQRMRELSVQGANDTYENVDKNAILDEMKELTDEIGRIKDTIQFNNMKVLDGSTGEVTLQVGANSGEVMKVDFNQEGINLSGIHESLTDVVSSLSGALATSGSSSTEFQDAITKIDAQVKLVSAGRSKLGAAQNRLEHTIKNLDNAAENLQASESRIRDVDMAKEMMEFTKQTILQQAATAMLAQSNSVPQTVLQLLR
ncbi:flagellin N-terminal helical domain-containing protein [Clostridium sp. Cult1]|uniref:flagellin N-terminal helical domain-containing protein n=1 Tax=Clostridium sp. Cult1 TaxID=2079002 RepID=UPI001F2795E7|nr:flagellin [Clostridium sp. Cult1]MCF6463976.1 flagellin [Clostridium sp. Cult1]